MKRRVIAGITVVILIVSFCFASMTPAFSADAVSARENVDNRPVAVNNDMPMRKAWAHDAISAKQAKELLNRQDTHPQRTGWNQLDSAIEALLEESGASDTYGKLWYVYQWMVLNVTYSWAGYSNDDSSVTAYNSFDGYDYLSSMDYEEGLLKSIPDDMANRAYHVLHRQMGICYDYAIAFAVVARYVGIESYVRTGQFTFENPALGASHHGWSILILDGEPYIFDPQRDARNWEQNDKHTGYYFGISSVNWYRYDPDYDSADTEANAQRDTEFLPLTAGRRPMTDVPTGAYYAAPVLWAAENEIAKGAAPFCFRPLDPCTRAQAVTFLWRAAGCPEPNDIVNPFADVESDTFYYKAVLWAVENGVTDGVSDTAFAPEAICTRGQIVSFLWRAGGCPDPVSKQNLPFIDVEEDAFYYNAVLWAVENKITNGMSISSFAPDSPCLRGQIVTFLYRSMHL